MEAQQKQRKRKQPPSNPFTGILTRQRSQIFTHNTRSGKSRPDPSRKIFKYQKSRRRNDEDDDGAVYHMSIKDLRARRIFSKPKTTSLEVESGMNLNPNLGSELNDGKLENPNHGELENPNLFSESNDDVECESLSDSACKNPNSTVVERCDGVAEFNIEGLNDGNPNLLVASIEVSTFKEEISGLLDVPKEQKIDVGFKGIAKMSDVLKGGITEENVQTTPPNALVHIAQGDDGSVVQNRNGCSRLPSKKISPSTETTNSIEAKRNMVLKPCSRMKIFKTPYSFSYKRLLPYLMDIANDTPCAPKVNPCPKIEIKAGEKPLVSSSMESVIDPPKFDEKPATITRKELACSLEFKGSDLITEQATTETFVSCSQDKSLVDWVSPHRTIEIPIKNESQKDALLSKLVDCDHTGTFEDVSLSVKPEALRKEANSEVHYQLALSHGRSEIPSLLVARKCDSKDNNVGYPNLSTLDKCDSTSFVASTVVSDVNAEISGLPNDGEVLDGVNGQNSNLLSPNIAEKNCNGFTGDNVQTTPPEAVVHIQQGDDGSALQTQNGCSISPSKKISASKEKKDSFDSKRNMVLKPCARMKLFKSPYSFSYRRLLPYLTDVANDTPYAAKVNPCPKTEIDPREKAVVSSPFQDSVTDIAKFDEKPPTVLVSPVNCSRDKNKVNLLSPKSIEIKDLIENDSLKGVSFGGVFSSKRSPEALKKDVNTGAQNQLALVDFKADDNSMSVLLHATAKPEEAVVTSSSTAKGILKRNPRGCRGICHCLDCSTFRLNAGKAFDFSRNQMLDTQQLVHDMINELLSLRVMLTKCVNGANNHVMLPVDQVQEACIKASNMEDIARNQLSQMNQDLFVHCRTKPLERPRVNFSSYVEENVIKKSSKEIDLN